MIKFDFTSHFIIVLCLMVILASTLIIIINSSVNSKWGKGPFMYFVQGPRVNMLRHCWQVLTYFNNVCTFCNRKQICNKMQSLLLTNDVIKTSLFTNDVCEQK